MPKGKAKIGPGPGSSAQQAGVANWSRRNNAPVLFLSIEDKPGSGNWQAANDLLRITTSFVHKRNLGKAGETIFILRNDDRKLLDDPRTFPNTEWRFRFGYFNDLSKIKSGIIREVAPDYKLKRTVTITLYDALLNASTKSSGKNWGKVSSTSIAKALANQYGWTFVGDDSADVPKKSWIQPNDLNDIRFLRDLAALIDFEVYLDGVPPTLYYRKKNYGSASRGRLTYYDDPTEYSYVKSFSPKVKSLGPIQAAVSGTDREKGKGDKKVNDDPSKSNPGLAVYITRSDTGAGKIVVAPVKKDVSVSAPSNTNTNALVQAARQQMLDKCNQAKSDHPLTPSITAGDIFEWAGIEKQLSGKWYCYEEHHEITGNQSQTRITWKRNTTGQGTDKAKNTNNNSGGTPSSVAFVRSQQGVASTYLVPGSSPAPTQGPKPVGK